MIKRRVAILGGGVGGLATAWALSNTQELRDRYEITVYQRGWRLGGKGASGRNAARYNSIEEHGLHVWLGFYDNAFRLMADIYAETGQRLDDYFKPIDHVVLYEQYEGDWNAHQFDPPPNGGRPGEGDRICFEEMVRTALDWLKAFAEDVVADTATTVSAADLVFDILSAPASAAISSIFDKVKELVADPRNHARVCMILASLRDLLWDQVVAPRVQEFHTRLFFQLYDTMATTTCGIIRDGLLQSGLDAANELDYLEWLQAHGAKPITLGSDAESGSPLIRGGYDLAFGFLKGNVKNRNMAAGVAIRGLLLLLFGYKGSFMYEMKTGMGDAIFAPLYKALETRGVKFEFFTWVDALHLDATGRYVESIAITNQASPLSSYEYLVDVNGEECWPSEPDWSNLQDGTQHRDQGAVFEREPSSPAGSIDAILSRGSDFDEVVLAVPPGAHPGICAELIADNPRFAAMVNASAVVMTQAFQLWMKEPVAALGWAHHPDSVMGSYVEPLDTYCNLTHLIAREGWPTGGIQEPQSLAYFCGVLDEQPGDDWQNTQARAKQNAIEFLQTHAHRFWPNAVVTGTTNFDWDKLVADGSISGIDRFEAQYWRANFDKSDRYVLSPKGSIEHRLDADESGYANLTLAGDWTKNGIDAGCVEAAVMSGLRAARAISGLPITIMGEDDSWLTCGAPTYVEYGGVVTSAPAFRCEKASLFGFVLEADATKIADLIDKVFNEPTRQEVRYLRLGSRVLLTIGKIDTLTHSDPDQGYIDEAQAAIWIPTARVLAGQVPLVPKGLAMFVPYLFVDNQLSLVGGREVFGYAKNPGRIRYDPSQYEFEVEAFGGDFAANSMGQWFSAIEIERRFSLSVPVPVPTGQLVAALDTVLAGAAAAAGLENVGALFADVSRLRVTESFLKQFRSVDGGDRAEWRPRVTEAPIVIDAIRELWYHPGQWTVTIDNRDSHDFFEDLGIGTQTATQAFSAEFDFTLQPGRVIWG